MFFDIFGCGTCGNNRGNDGPPIEDADVPESSAKQGGVEKLEARSLRRRQKLRGAAREQKEAEADVDVATGNEYMKKKIADLEAQLALAKASSDPKATEVSAFALDSQAESKEAEAKALLEAESRARVEGEVEAARRVQAGVVGAQARQDTKGAMARHEDAAKVIQGALRGDRARQSDQIVLGIQTVNEEEATAAIQEAAKREEEVQSNGDIENDEKSRIAYLEAQIEKMAALQVAQNVQLVKAQRDLLSSKQTMKATKRKEKKIQDLREFELQKAFNVQEENARLKDEVEELHSRWSPTDSPQPSTIAPSEESDYRAAESEATDDFPCVEEMSLAAQTPPAIPAS